MFGYVVGVSPVGTENPFSHIEPGDMSNSKSSGSLLEKKSFDIPSEGVGAELPRLGAELPRLGADPTVSSPNPLEFMP